MEKRLTEQELAARFRKSTRTIQLWRKKGVGPAFITVGVDSVLYREEDVIAYEEKRCSIPEHCRRSMRRAAATLDKIAGWEAIKPATRNTVEAVRDELRELIGGA